MKQEPAGTAESFDHRAFLKTLTIRPGVYRMLGADGEILYVGKARSLRKRVTSYFTGSNQGPKTRSLMEQVHSIEVTVTHTENEALILENNLIKQHRPRYNVLLRDDKSYPYIYLSTEQEFPRLTFHRGARKGRGRYFGPYPSAGAVRESLSLLQKLFQVRQCEESFYRNRSRPCLQYQIKRCTAPCVGLIDAPSYQRDVKLVEMFLEGKGPAVIEALAGRMEQAAQNLEFELAARYRDQIGSLRRVQEHQYVSGAKGELDIVACQMKSGVACVSVTYIRAGYNLGNKAFFPVVPAGTDAAGVLGAFLPQFYLDKDVPREILVNHAIEGAECLVETLSEKAGHRIGITTRVRGDRAQWLRMATDNAGYALDARLSSRTGMRGRLEALRNLLELEEIPDRMECFDISHTSGEATVASCVVFDGEGPRKSDYRRFNIKGIQPGDDYGAMEQALTRRYVRLRDGEGVLPDILFIDGGKGQLRKAHEMVEELQFKDVTLVGVAKGAGRKAGLEQLFLWGRSAPIILPADSAALHLVQHIRDEAHRFAITGHRQRRARERRSSVLEQIPGMGPKRRQLLLRQFGGLREVARAGVQDLANVPGISKQLANRIYDAFHSEQT